MIDNAFQSGSFHRIVRPTYGTKVKIEKEKGDYFRIFFSEGKIGWMVEKIRKLQKEPRLPTSPLS